MTDYASRNSATSCSSAPEVGASVTKGEPFGTIESVKAVSDLFSPVSGEVTSVNEDLANQPELVNDEPYGAGWLIEVHLEDPEAQLESLLDAAAYEAHCDERE